MEVVWPDVADEREVMTDVEDDWNALGAVQLRLDKVRVDLLQLVNPGDRIQVRP